MTTLVSEDDYHAEIFRTFFPSLAARSVSKKKKGMVAEFSSRTVSVPGVFVQTIVRVWLKGKVLLHKREMFSTSEDILRLKSKDDLIQIINSLKNKLGSSLKHG